MHKMGFLPSLTYLILVARYTQPPPMCNTDFNGTFHCIDKLSEITESMSCPLTPCRSLTHHLPYCCFTILLSNTDWAQAQVILLSVCKAKKTHPAQGKYDRITLLLLGFLLLLNKVEI